MSYRGGDLQDLFRDSTVGPPTRRALRRIANDAGHAMTEAAAAHTPKDTGQTASKWRSLKTERVPDGYQSGTENPSFKARLLEYGVEPHELKPKDADALNTPEGPRGGAHHPGFAGSHALAKAAAEVDAALPAIAEPALREWQAEVERRAKRHRGIT